LKNYYEQIKLTNDVLVKNLENLYMNNTDNTGLLVEHTKVKSLYENNVLPMLNATTQSADANVGVMISRAHKMMTSNCNFIRKAFDYYLNSYCRHNLRVLNANVW